MDGIKVAWCSWLAAQRFLFWTLVEATTKAIYWHKEASRELLILKPRRPKDLYDASYVLFVWDISSDAWRGYWRTPSHQPGMPAAEVYELAAPVWGNVPFHEVEFSDMPEVTFKVRAVSLEWCRGQMPQTPAPVQPEPRLPLAADPQEIAQAQAEPIEQPVRH